MSLRLKPGEACMMHDVQYIAIVVRRIYNGDKNYDTVVRFLDALYASRRLQLPLEGVLAVGY